MPGQPPDLVSRRKSLKNRDAGTGCKFYKTRIDLFRRFCYKLASSIATGDPGHGCPGFAAESIEANWNRSSRRRSPVVRRLATQDKE